ncbi:MAG: hypothetical protein KY457_09715 [Actinobacteria bacterium]|nr:hypothetical protein [Actinomycetota bacterium]
MAGRCLVVANQTLGGTELSRALEDCIARGIRRFHVVVPRTPVEHETAIWTGGYGIGDGFWMPAVAEDELEEILAENSRRRQAADEEAERRARLRLDRVLEQIRAAGGAADGEVGSEDPLEAATQAMAHPPPFDEVIVSTLPSGISRWLQMDLPSRIGRLTDAPVTTIEAEPDRIGADPEG